MKSLKKACGREREQKEGGEIKRECGIKESLRRVLKEKVQIGKDPRGETHEKLSVSICLKWAKL